MGDGVQGGTSPPLSAMTVTEPPCRTTAFGPDTYRVGSHVPPHPRRGGCRPRRLKSTPWTAWSAASPASGPPTPPPCTRGGTWWCSAATPPSTTCSWTTSTCGTVSGMPPFLWLLPSRPSVCTRIRLLCVCVFVWVSLFLHINLQVSVWRHPIPNAALPSNWAPLPPFQPSQPAACRGSDQHRGDGPFRAPPPTPGTCGGRSSPSPRWRQRAGWATARWWPGTRCTYSGATVGSPSTTCGCSALARSSGGRRWVGVPRECRLLFNSADPLGGMG